MKFTRLHLDQDHVQIGSLHPGLNLVYCPTVGGIAPALQCLFASTYRPLGAALSGRAELMESGHRSEVVWTDDGAPPQIHGEAGGQAAVAEFLRSLRQRGLESLIAVDFRDAAELADVVRRVLQLQDDGRAFSLYGEMYPWRERPDLEVDWDRQPQRRVQQESDLRDAQIQLQRARNCLRDAERTRTTSAAPTSALDSPLRRAEEIRRWVASARRELNMLDSELAVADGASGRPADVLIEEQVRSLQGQIDRVHRVSRDIQQRLEQVRHRLGQWAQVESPGESIESLRAACAALDVQIQRLARETLPTGWDADIDYGGYDFALEQYLHSPRPRSSQANGLLDAIRQMQKLVEKQAESVLRRDLHSEGRHLRKCHASLRNRLKRLMARRAELQSGARGRFLQQPPDELEMLHRRREDCLARLRRWENELELVLRSATAATNHDDDVDQAYWRSEVARLEQRVDRLATASDRRPATFRSPARPTLANVLARASQLLQRMSDSLYRELQWDAACGAVTAVGPDGQRSAFSSCSPCVQRLIALSVILAVGESVGEREFPMVLDGLLTRVDVERHAAVLEVLGDHCRHGAQLIVTLQRTQDVQRCEDRRLPVQRAVHADRQAWTRGHHAWPHTAPLASRETGSAGGQSAPVVPPRREHESTSQPLFGAVVSDVSKPIYDWPADHAASPFHDSGGAPTAPRRASQPPPTAAGQMRGGRDGRFHLDFLDLISRVPFLQLEAARQLEAAGVWTVADFIRADAQELQRRLGGSMAVAKLREEQAQALLMCSVARLRAYDARILVACGVTDPVQLQNLDPLELARTVERFSHTPHGRHVLSSGSPFEMARIQRWIESAQRNRPEGDRSYSQQSYSDPPMPRRFAGQDAAEVGLASRRDSEFAGGDPERAWKRQRKRKRHVERMQEHERAPESAAAAAQGKAGGVEPSQRMRELRFFLDQTSDVEAGPSIGSKTAERLYALGVRTVADLLQADPEQIGRQLGRRFTAKTVTEWQQQAALVCQVPELRGHDAQLLVACGVTEAAQLAAQDPAQLSAAVQRLVETKAGMRIIRSGPRPTREEVEGWVRWAKQYRKIRAA